MAELKSNPLVDGALLIVRRLKEAGFIGLWAGGCVRDMLTDRPPKDFDVATNALPEDVMRIFPRSVAVGKAFGVVRVPCGERVFEVATFRQDHAYSDGRRPDGVTFSDPETDARRRDFTINALFFDPLSGKVHDFVGGQADLKDRLVRAVGDPDERFREDHLRMIRAIRFAACLGFSIHPETWKAVKRNAPLIEKVSKERVQQELTRILLESPRPGDAVDALSEAGLLAVILPEVEGMKGQDQPPEFHPEGDVYTHTIMMLNAMSDRSLRLAYAVMLHDIGKPGTARNVGGRIRFDNHARFGSHMTESVMKRLRFPSDDVKAVSYCVANHMRFMDVKRMRRSTLARLVGAPTFPIELELHRLDCAASHGDQENYNFLLDFQRARESVSVLPEPFIKGEDILKMGVPSGPLVGEWKKRAYNAQLEDKFIGKDAALAWLKARLRDEKKQG